MKQMNETFSDVFSASALSAAAVVRYFAYGFYFWPQAN